MAPCDPGNPNIYEDGNGNLVIRAIHTASGTWTSGRMKTQGLAAFNYGRVEARLQLPVGAGIWPAFWMLGSSITARGWPDCGEVDVMENVPLLGAAAIQSSLHAADFYGSNSLHGIYHFPSGQAVNTGFHVYGVIWSPFILQFYVDDPANVFVTLTPPKPGSSWPFNDSTNPFFLLLNLAIGGSWPGNPDNTTPNPALMLVDYVRVYRAAAVAGPAISGAAISVTAGQTGNSTLSLSATGNTTGKVFLACSGQPTASACGIAPNWVDFTVNPTNTAVLTVTTTARAVAGPGWWRWRRWIFPALGLWVLAAVALLRKRARSRPMPAAAALPAIGAAIFSLMSCGGSSNSLVTPPAQSNGTPAGAYTLQVTAYTVSGATSTGNITLNVN